MFARITAKKFLIQITTDAEKRASFRLLGVTTKLNPREVEDVERLARSRGLQRGELIRKLILDELARDAGSVEASTELTEIMGIRLMLTNLFRPLATGQKLTRARDDSEGRAMTSVWIAAKTSSGTSVTI